MLTNLFQECYNLCVVTYEDKFSKFLQDPQGVYTYCPEYNSACIETSEKSLSTWYNREEEKHKWLNEEGFTVSNSKTALESNRHSLKPDNARVMELSKVGCQYI